MALSDRVAERLGLGIDSRDRRHQAVAAFGNGLDHRSGSVRALQDAPQGRDAAHQRVVADEGVAPHVLHELVVGDHLAGTPGEEHQDIHDLGLDVLFPLGTDHEVLVRLDFASGDFEAALLHDGLPQHAVSRPKDELVLVFSP